MTLKWKKLNDLLRDADEAVCKKMLADEQAGEKRPTYIKRIHSRLNKVRADRERKELGVDVLISQ